MEATLGYVFLEMTIAHWQCLHAFPGTLTALAAELLFSPWPCLHLRL